MSRKHRVKYCLVFSYPSAVPLPAVPLPCLPAALSPAAASRVPCCVSAPCPPDERGRLPGAGKSQSSDGRVFAGGILPASQRGGDERDDQEAVQPVRGEAAGGTAEAQRREGGSPGVYVLASDQGTENVPSVIVGGAAVTGFLPGGESADANVGEGQGVYSLAPSLPHLFLPLCIPLFALHSPQSLPLNTPLSLARLSGASGLLCSCAPSPSICSSFPEIPSFPALAPP